MYTVLIADDEKIERNGIRRLLNKEKDSYRILEAENGRDAEKIIREDKVDILLTDIRMPYVNGLELARKTSECSGNTQIIIFSGYHDFSYARMAIQYGVQDYILKPVDPGEFDRAFLHVRQNLSSRKENIEGKKTRVRLLNQYFLLNYILSGRQSVLRAAEKHIDTSSWDLTRYMVMVERRDGFFEKYGDEFQETLTRIYRDRALYLNLNTDQALLLVCGGNTEPSREAERLMSCLDRKYGSGFYVAVSREISTKEELPEAYRRLDELMEEKFYHTERHLFCEAPAGTGEKLLEEGCLIGMLEKDIRNRDVYHVEEHFDRVVKKYSGNSGFPSMYVKFVFTNIVKVLGESSPMSDDRDMEKVIDEMYGCPSVNELIAIAKKEVDRFLKHTAEDKSSLKYKVDMTKEYIEKHYMDDIQVEQMAARLCLSTGYLSMMFKKEIGENIKQYIRNVRMKKAEELLTDTQMSVREVGEKTGLRNMSYFSKCFRQQYGDTPESYRRKKQLS